MPVIGIYCAYVLDLPFDAMPIRLYGLIGIRDGQASFALSSTGSPDDEIGRNTLKRLFPNDATREIVDPLGLRGVTIDALALAGTIVRDAAGKAAVQMRVSASARFPNLPASPRLAATMIVDANQIRLVRVALVLATPLTLTDILVSILGAAGRSAALVTDEFAFTGGALYWLEKPAGRDDTYRFMVDTTEYRPGYHIEGGFRLFGRYAFDARLSLAADRTMTVAASVDRLADFDFFALGGVALLITRGERLGPITLSIATITILGTDIAQVDATYATATRQFTGTVSRDLRGIDLPIVGPRDVTLAIDFAWSRENGLRITGIGGLPDAHQALGGDRLGSLLDALDVGKGGCEALIGSWFAKVGISLEPALQPGRSPYRQGDMMRVPLQISYVLKFGNDRIAPDAPPVTFDWGFGIPRSLGDLPAAIFGTMLDNLGAMLTAILSNPSTYAALAIAVGAAVGARAAARLACRALERFGKEIAKRIVEGIKTLADDTIAAIAELAGVTISIAVAGIAVALSALEAIWDEIKKLFTDDDDDKEEKAAEQLDPIRRDVEAVVASVRAKVAEATGKLQIASVETRLDPQQGVCVDVYPMDQDRPVAEAGIHLDYVITLLTGGVGDEQGSRIGGTTTADPAYCMPLSSLTGMDFRMNASARLRMTGAVFMNRKTRDTLVGYHDQVGEIDADAARALQRTIGDALQYLDVLNADGVMGNPRFAGSAVSPFLTVGQSLLGFNSRVAA